jgi:hypothetical protein
MKAKSESCAGSQDGVFAQALLAFSWATDSKLQAVEKRCSDPPGFLMNQQKSALPRAPWDSDKEDRGGLPEPGSFLASRAYLPDM